MKTELKLNQIETTKLGTEICHLKLTLILADNVMTTAIKCDLSSTGISDFKLNSSHTITELHTLTRWFETTDKKGVMNRIKVRKFVKEMLEANKTLRTNLSL